jgi:uncharacterized OsmC-like protein
MVSIKQKIKVKLRVNGYCPTHSRCEVSVRDVGMTIDEPVERGGTNAGPAPTDTALAALVGCTNTIGHKCARALGVDIGHLDIAVVCDLDRRGVTLQEEIEVPFERIDLMVNCSGAASQADLDRVAAEVRKFCPVSKLFRRAGTEIVEHWQAAAT